MRTIETKVYTFDELSDNAKEHARAWYRENLEYPWYDDAKASIDAFCLQFDVRVTDYNYGPFNRDNYIKTNATPANFRGFKLTDFNREAMPTGYCLDCTLAYTFADEFKRTGDAFAAFKDALDAAIADIVSDAEYQYTDEAIDDAILANCYEFTQDGAIL